MDGSGSEAVTAFVLTGGKSERMGSDKALLQLPDGQTMLEHALALGASVAGETRIVGPRGRYAQFAWAGSLIEDVFAGKGPLGGIHAALSSSTTEWNLVLAVDAPLITRELLQWLVRRAQASNTTVTVPRIGGRLQTLCAVYRKNFGEVAQRALEQDRNRIETLYGEVTTEVVDEAELRGEGFGPELFANCNTAEDLKQLFAGSPATNFGR